MRNRTILYKYGTVLPDSIMFCVCLTSFYKTLTRPHSKRLVRREKTRLPSEPLLLNHDAFRFVLTFEFTTWQLGIQYIIGYLMTANDRHQPWELRPWPSWSLNIVWRYLQPFSVVSRSWCTSPTFSTSGSSDLSSAGTLCKTLKRISKKPLHYLLSGGRHENTDITRK